MNIPPLCIIQARYGSTRLPGKMLLPLCGKPLIQHVWERSVEAFGESNVVVAVPANEENAPLRKTLDTFGAAVFAWDGEERDVLGRFHACAHRYRWHPDSVIVRVTPDDWNKSVKHMRENALSGIRHPVELGAEAFTLAMLDETYRVYGGMDRPHREHLTLGLFPTEPPRCPDMGVPMSIDTQADYEAVKAYVERAA